MVSMMIVLLLLSVVVLVQVEMCCNFQSEMARWVGWVGRLDHRVVRSEYVTRCAF